MTVLALNIAYSEFVLCAGPTIVFLEIIYILVAIVVQKLIVLARVCSSGRRLVASAAWSKGRIFMLYVLHWFPLYFLLYELIIKYVVQFIFLLSEVFFHIYWIYLGAWQIVHKSLFFPILLFLKSRIALAHFIYFLIILNKLIVLLVLIIFWSIL